MPIIPLPYHKEIVDLNIPNNVSYKVLLPKTTEPSKNSDSIIQNVLKDSNLEQLVTGNKTIGIAINDQTRPVPLIKLLPPLLEYLQGLGIKKKNITFYIATGTHKPVSEEIKTAYLPEFLLNNYQIECHDCMNNDQLEYLGQTKAKTPVFINRNYYNSDLKLAVGNLEPHHFMGYSGGAKTVAIGLTGYETIQNNHSMLKLPNTTIGKYEENPMRMDVEEIGSIIGLDFVLNAVIDTNKEILNVFAGNPRDIMTDGITYLQNQYFIKTSELYDLVIVSTGGYPKDINFYQSQKAISSAVNLVKPGGTILLAAACVDGIGSQPLEEFLDLVDSPQNILDWFETNEFSVGPHKGYLLARQLKKCNIVIYTKMDHDQTNKLFIKKTDSIDQFVKHFCNDETKPKIAVLPYGVTTVIQQDAL